MRVADCPNCGRTVEYTANATGGVRQCQCGFDIKLGYSRVWCWFAVVLLVASVATAVLHDVQTGALLFIASLVSVGLHILLRIESRIH